MTSDLAKIAVEEMWSLGLRPTVDDIVRLNALALRAERGTNGDGYASIPRIAFLGDYILQEPTIGKMLWLEQARRVVGGDFHSLMALTAFVLHKSVDELPPLKSVKAVKKAVTDFYDDVLIAFTETEIVAKIAYCLHGHKADVGANVDAANVAAPRVDEVPDTMISAVRIKVGDLVREGVGYDSVLPLTLAQAEGLRVRVLVAKFGNDAMKVLKDDALGEFYRAADTIKERLTNGNQ